MSVLVIGRHAITERIRAFAHSAPLEPPGRSQNASLGIRTHLHSQAGRSTPDRDCPRMLRAPIPGPRPRTPRTGPGFPGRGRRRSREATRVTGFPRGRPLSGQLGIRVAHSRGGAVVPSRAGERRAGSRTPLDSRRCPMPARLSISCLAVLFLLSAVARPQELVFERSGAVSIDSTDSARRWLRSGMWTATGSGTSSRRAVPGSPTRASATCACTRAPPVRSSTRSMARRSESSSDSRWPRSATSTATATSSPVRRAEGATFVDGVGRGDLLAIRDGEHHVFSAVDGHVLLGGWPCGGSGYVIDSATAGDVHRDGFDDIVVPQRPFEGCDRIRSGRPCGQEAGSTCAATGSSR